MRTTDAAISIQLLCRGDCLAMLSVTPTAAAGDNWNAPTGRDLIIQTTTVGCFMASIFVINLFISNLSTSYNETNMEPKNVDYLCFKIQKYFKPVPYSDLLV